MYINEYIHIYMVNVHILLHGPTRTHELALGFLWEFPRAVCGPSCCGMNSFDSTSKGRVSSKLQINDDIHIYAHMYIMNMHMYVHKHIYICICIYIYICRMFIYIYILLPIACPRFLHVSGHEQLLVCCLTSIQQFLGQVLEKVASFVKVYKGLRCQIPIGEYSMNSD